MVLLLIRIVLIAEMLQMIGHIGMEQIVEIHTTMTPDVRHAIQNMIYPANEMAGPD